MGARFSADLHETIDAPKTRRAGIVNRIAPPLRTGVRLPAKRVEKVHLYLYIAPPRGKHSMN